jgi:hypothetical protein
MCVMKGSKIDPYGTYIYIYIYPPPPPPTQRMGYGRFVECMMYECEEKKIYKKNF